MPETLDELETRLRRLHADHVAAAPPKNAMAMDKAELAAWEQKYLHAPVPTTPLPPTERRSNVYPPPPVITAATSAWDMDARSLAAFEAQHGLRQTWR